MLARGQVSLSVDRGNISTDSHAHGKTPLKASVFHNNFLSRPSPLGLAHRNLTSSQAVKQIAFLKARGPSVLSFVFRTSRATTFGLLLFEQQPENPYWLNIEFPQFHGKIYISYIEIGGKSRFKVRDAKGNYIDSVGTNTFDNLIKSSYALTYKHTYKASSIDDSAFTTANHVEGVYFKIGGNAATAADAADWGLIHQAVDGPALDTTAEELLQRLASGPTVAIGLAKQALSFGAHATLSQSMTQELYNLELSCRTSDFKEGLEAFRQRRDPEFRGR